MQSPQCTLDKKKLKQKLRLLSNYRVHWYTTTTTQHVLMLQLNQTREFVYGIQPYASLP